MPDAHPITMLCISSEFKGTTFIEECKRQGCHVILLTREKFKHEDWPRESIDEIFFMPTLENLPDVIHGVSYLARSRTINRITPLDDFDVERAAALREHLRLPGMGESATRFFRDKLAMRMQAREHGILVPPFSAVLNYDWLRDFMNGVAPPWMFKPRSSAGAMGIKQVHSQEELWRRLDTLGDQQSYYLLEKFIAGDVYHVDSIVSEGEVIFTAAHQYGQPPMSVSHGGGIFTTRTLRRDSNDAREVLALNRQVIRALGMVRGINHIEYIKGHEDGRFYFLEAAARVGGANIAELVEFETGVNLWAEWAKVEVAHARGESYHLPATRQDYAGMLICLARQEYPDLSAYDDPEIVWRLKRKNHAGLIVKSPDPQRVESLLDNYSERFARDFLAVLPPLERPPA